MLLYLRPCSIFIDHDSITCSQLLRLPYSFPDNRPLSCWSGLEVANRPTAVGQLLPRGAKRWACGRRGWDRHMKKGPPARSKKRRLSYSLLSICNANRLLYSHFVTGRVPLRSHPKRKLEDPVLCFAHIPTSRANGM